VKIYVVLLTALVNSSFLVTNSSLPPFFTLSLLRPQKGCARYCDEYVCLSVRSHKTRKPYGQISPNFWAYCLWPWLGVLLWLCDILGTSGFVDAVTFSQNGLSVTEHDKHSSRRYFHKMLLNNKDRKYSLLVAPKVAMSAICDCLYYFSPLGKLAGRTMFCLR